MNGHTIRGGPSSRRDRTIDLGFWMGKNFILRGRRRGRKPFCWKTTAICEALALKKETI